MKPKAFSTAAGFRAWLEQHHDSTPELMVRCYKQHAKEKGMGYFEAVDEALCFGWIDGVRRSFDGSSFIVRFSRRRQNSIWSAVNIKRASQLEQAGRMQPSGLTALRSRNEQRSRIYSFESKPVELDEAYLLNLQSNDRAWKFFMAQPPWYRRTSQFWIMSAKREETRKKRLAILITRSEQGKPIPLLDRTPQKSGSLSGKRRRKLT